MRDFLCRPGEQGGLSAELTLSYVLSVQKKKKKIWVRGDSLCPCMSMSLTEPVPQVKKYVFMSMWTGWYLCWNGHKYNMKHQDILASKRSHWALQLCRNKKLDRAFKCLYLWLLRCYVNIKNLEVGYMCGELPPADASRRQVQTQTVRVLFLPQ